MCDPLTAISTAASVFTATQKPDIPAPPAPEAPAPPPTVTDMTAGDASAKTSRQDALKKMAAADGMGKTIVTGGLGDTSQAPVKLKTLLGM
jgi:hypothetical protein